MRNERRTVMVSANRWTNHLQLFCPYAKRNVTFRASWRRVSRPGQLSFPLLEDRSCDAAVGPTCRAHTKAGGKNYFQCPHVAEGLKVP